MTNEESGDGFDVRVRRAGYDAPSESDGSPEGDRSAGPEEETARAVVEAVLGSSEPDLTPAESEALVSVARASEAFPLPVDASEVDGSLSALGAALIEPTERMEESRDRASLVDAVRDALWVARIAVATTRRAASYSLRSGVRTGARMLRAAGSARSLEDFVSESQKVAMEEMDRLGVDFTEGDNPLRNGEVEDAVTVTELRARGEHLLELSADVEHDETVHPAFPGILDQLAPDEARILRYLATEGPQPVVDVRDVGWMPITSELVGAGLSMVGTEAGCRYEDRTQAYLNNLQRLGLVWFSDEQVDNVRRYQLVEAQPKVMEARDECKRPRVVRRSIHLTPFGVDFCRVCLPLGGISDKASSVYHPPKDRTNGEWRGSGGAPDEDEEGGMLEDEGDGGIRNPHLDDHWE
jgi:hypothetical protein